MLYDVYWKEEMSRVIVALNAATNTGHSKLDVSGIKRHGRRKDYEVDFRIVNGKAEFKRTYGSTKEK